MKENSKMVMQKEEVHIITQMVKSMLEIINKMQEMGMVYITIQMETDILENLKKGKKMEKGHSMMKMETKSKIYILKMVRG
jgi:hypothetical protein